jgi:hypothetical protein
MHPGPTTTVPCAVARNDMAILKYAAPLSGRPMSTDDMRPRATRYEFGAVILYRRLGESVWQEGWTLNVSRTGVLFTGVAPVIETNGRIEMIVVLPDFGAGGVSRIRCGGRVVRTGEHAGKVSMAATIEQYRFLKPCEAVSLEPETVGSKQ